MWVACIRDEAQVATVTGAEHHSMLSTRPKSSSLCQRGVEKDQNTMEKVVLKMAKTGNREVHSELEESCVSPSEYGQTKPVKTRRPQKEQHVSRWSSD